MKYFDVVNEHDEVVGSANSIECHSNPKLIHRVVHFTLVDPTDKLILITQRSPNVKFDSGKWCFMGEHLLQGDEYPTAVHRGLKDELGLKGNLAIRELGHTIFYQEKQTELARFFVAFHHEGNIQPDSTEISKIKWINLKELKQHIDNRSTMTQFWVDIVDWNQLIH